MRDIAQLYARRWDIELAFKLLKCELGLHLWWGARPELVLIQLWLALILAQLLHALQLHVAMQAEVDPFDVSMHVLVELLERSRQNLRPLSTGSCKTDVLSDSFAPPAASRSWCLRSSHTCSVRRLISRISCDTLAMPNAILIPGLLLSSLASRLNF